MIIINDFSFKNEKKSILNVWDNKNIQLKNELQCIIDTGIKRIDGYALSNAFIDPDHTLPDSDFLRKYFTDKTGYEVSFNSFHTEDYIQEDHLEQSILFVKKLFEKWNNEGHIEVLKCLVIKHKNTSDTVIKFHVVRSGEIWEGNVDDNYSEVHNYYVAVYIFTSTLFR